MIRLGAPKIFMTAVIREREGLILATTFGSTAAGVETLGLKKPVKTRKTKRLMTIDYDIIE